MAMLVFSKGNLTFLQLERKRVTCFCWTSDLYREKSRRFKLSVRKSAVNINLMFLKWDLLSVWTIECLTVFVFSLWNISSDLRSYRTKIELAISACMYTDYAKVRMWGKCLDGGVCDVHLFLLLEWIGVNHMAEKLKLISKFFCCCCCSSSSSAFQFPGSHILIGNYIRLLQ